MCNLQCEDRKKRKEKREDDASLLVRGSCSAPALAPAARTCLQNLSKTLSLLNKCVCVCEREKERESERENEQI